MQVLGVCEGHVDVSSTAKHSNVGSFEPHEIQMVDKIGFPSCINPFVDASHKVQYNNPNCTKTGRREEMMKRRSETWGVRALGMLPAHSLAPRQFPSHNLGSAQSR